MIALKSLDVSKAIDKAASENRQRQLTFTAWMRSTGITADTVNAVTRSNMASHYLTDRQQPAIATADMFDLLRPHLPDVPEEIERLVAERTGIEWSAYVRRPVTQQAKGSLRPGPVISFDQRASTDRERRDVPATDAARQWQGWGTALKPASEMIVVARKPLAGTVAANVQQWGTGALNIAATRVPGDVPTTVQGQSGNAGTIYGADQRDLRQFVPNVAGRWPPNVVLDGHAAAELDRQTGDASFNTAGIHGTQRQDAPDNQIYGKLTQPGRPVFGYGDRGGSSRFFPVFRYAAKAPASERPKGDDGTGHPTVKPLDLMRWLVRLVTPPGGLVLDPFAGSGTTGEACVIEGFRCLLIENDPESLPRIVNRLTKPIQPDMFGGAG